MTNIYAVDTDRNQEYIYDTFVVIQYTLSPHEYQVFLV